MKENLDFIRYQLNNDYCLVFDNIIGTSYAEKLFDAMGDELVLEYDNLTYKFPELITIADQLVDKFMSFKDSKRVPVLESIHCVVMHKYDEQTHQSYFYETHDDVDDGNYISGTLYVTPDQNEWVGGELALYGNFSYQEFPSNTVHVRPLCGRACLFPARIPHRIKPWMCDIPRKAIVFSWKIPESNTRDVIVI